jgi:acetolactate synthase-1/2/3 large subunit
MVSCITKYAVTILEPNEIRHHLEKAWHSATSGRMGPVWLDIPLDVQAAMIDETQLPGFTPEPEINNITDLQSTAAQLVRLLNAAERPLILSGHGFKRRRQAILVNFANKKSVL